MNQMVVAEVITKVIKGQVTFKGQEQRLQGAGLFPRMVSLSIVNL